MSTNGRQTPEGLDAMAAPARQAIEHLVVALILAFVFRAFVVEAYRIPTGSMAPTLYGAHRHRVCSNCGYHYAYEVAYREGRSGVEPVCPKITRCPNCEWEEEAAPLAVSGRYVIDSGDRILVMKLGYELAAIVPSLGDLLGPRRWDVVVFKNPSDPTVNYIKRLIGLPNETLEIIDGDIYIDGQIARKPDHAQKCTWFLVSDRDYLPTIRGSGRFDAIATWAPRGPGGEHWDTSGRVLVFKGAAADASGTIGFCGPITDYYAYDDPREQDETAVNVSDLRLATMVVVREGDGAVTLSLSKRDELYEARIETCGMVTLWRTELDSGRGPDILAAGQIPPIRPKVPVRIAFENVDYRVRLMIDGREVLRTTDDQYHPDPRALRFAPPDQRRPRVAIAAQGIDAQFWHTTLHRDIYYEKVHITENAADNPFEGELGHGVAGNPIHLGSDAYYVLGDNSPKSKDSRLWWEIGPHLAECDRRGDYQAGTVPRDQMVGKALFVYWPAGHRILGSGPAIIPNFGDMRFIR